MRFVLVVAAAFFCAGAAAQQPAFPGGSLVWIHAEVRIRDDASAALIGDGCARAMEALLGDEQTARTVGALAMEATRQGAAWSLCVMEYGAEWRGEKRRITKLSAMFSVDAPADLDRFAAALPPGGDGAIAHTPRFETAAYDRGEPWQRIAWQRARQRLFVGFGTGPFDGMRGAGEAATLSWFACHGALPAGDGAAVLTVWLDLNALRRAMPDHFTDTPVGRMVAACGAPNGRGLLLSVSELPHAEDEPVTLAAALAWSARSEPLDTAHSVDLTEPGWPDGLARPAGAEWSMAIRAGWGTWIEAVLNAWVDSGTEREQKARAVRRTSWMRDHGVSLAGLIRASGPYIVISGGDQALEGRFGMTGDVRSESRGVFNSLGKSVRFDHARGVWRWSLGRGGIEWAVESGTLLARPALPEVPDEPGDH